MVVPLALSPSPPTGLGPADLLIAVMAPFLVHPTPSYAMLVGHSRLALNRHIAVVLRSVTTPRHGRGHGPKATVVANHGDKGGGGDDYDVKFVKLIVNFIVVNVNVEIYVASPFSFPLEGRIKTPFEPARI